MTNDIMTSIRDRHLSMRQKTHPLHHCERRVDQALQLRRPLGELIARAKQRNADDRNARAQRNTHDAHSKFDCLAPRQSDTEGRCIKLGIFVGACACRIHVVVHKSVQRDRIKRKQHHQKRATLNYGLNVRHAHAEAECRARVDREPIEQTQVPKVGRRRHALDGERGQREAICAAAHTNRVDLRQELHRLN